MENKKFYTHNCIECGKPALFIKICQECLSNLPEPKDEAGRTRKAHTSHNNSYSN